MKAVTMIRREGELVWFQKHHRPRRLWSWFTGCRSIVSAMRTFVNIWMAVVIVRFAMICWDMGKNYPPPNGATSAKVVGRIWCTNFTSMFSRPMCGFPGSGWCCLVIRWGRLLLVVTCSTIMTLTGWSWPASRTTIHYGGAVNCLAR